MRWRFAVLVVSAMVIVAIPGRSFAADIDEFKVKRQDVFEFTEIARPASADDAADAKVSIETAGVGHSTAWPPPAEDSTCPLRTAGCSV